MIPPVNYTGGHGQVWDLARQPLLFSFNQVSCRNQIITESPEILGTGRGLSVVVEFKVETSIDFCPHIQ